MSHTAIITTGGGIIRHYNAVATKPGFCVQKSWNFMTAKHQN